MSLALVERDIETLIDNQLRNLRWIDDPKSKDRNVFKQQVKTEEQKKSLGGKRPDYVLYRSNSNEPLIVIEAKRPNKNIKEAIDQALWYAERIRCPMAYVTDSVYIKAIHVKLKKPLYKNGEEVDEFIGETQALQYLKSNEINTIDKYVIRSRQELIKIFDSANRLLRQEGLQAGIERFSEFSNILFLKLISELESIKEKKSEKSTIEKEFRWEYFKQKRGNELLSYVNDTVLKNFKKKYDDDTIFKNLQIQNPVILEKIIDKIDPLSLTDINSDVKGDAFEYFLSKYTAQNNTDLGEYFTPRHVVKTCVKLINPQIGETIYDPFCGTGGMLIEAFNHIYNNAAHTDTNINMLKQKTIYGNEITKNARIAKMNMILMGDGHNNIQRKDSLANKIKNKYDIVITNMPFSQDTLYGNSYDIPTKDGNSICIQHCIEAVNAYSSNGRMAIIVPDGVLENKKYKSIREYILAKSIVKVVVSLPTGVFSPYSNSVKTNILYLSNIKQKKKQGHYWYFRVKEGDYSQIHSKKQIEADLKTLIIHRSDCSHALFNKVALDSIKSQYYKMTPKNTKIHNKYATLISDICLESNKRAGKEYKKYLLVSISNKKGFVPKEDFYKKKSQQTTSKTPENYKLVYPNQFAYRVTEGLAIGTVGYNQWDRPVMVSPIYPVFSIKEDKVLAEYLYIVLTSDQFKVMAKNLLSGTSRPSLPFEIFKDIEIPLPPLQIQKKIVSKRKKIFSMEESIKNIQKEIKSNMDAIWKT